MIETTPTYSSIEQLQERKEALHADLQAQSQKIGELWGNLTTSQPANSKGELIANLVNNSITAIDAFLLARKLMKVYGKYFPKKKRR